MRFGCANIPRQPQRRRRRRLDEYSRTWLPLPPSSIIHVMFVRQLVTVEIKRTYVPHTARSQVGRQAHISRFAYLQCAACTRWCSPRVCVYTCMIAPRGTNNYYRTRELQLNKLIIMLSTRRHGRHHTTVTLWRVRVLICVCVCRMCVRVRERL